MEPFERLDQAMNHRRLELRLNWRKVAEAAHISYTALRAIRRGDYRPAELTARGLDEALRWTPGSVHAVLDGGQPTPVELSPPEAPASVRPSGEAGSSVLDQELAFAARVMAAAIKELGLSPDEADEAWRQARERIVRTHPPEAGDEDPSGGVHPRAG